MTSNKSDISMDLLTNSDFTDVHSPRIDVDLIGFATKREAAVYLNKLFGGLSKQDLLNDAGLWTWLSLFYFDVVCPKQSGERKVRNDYTYIFEPKSSRHFYRHLLFVSWRILDIAPNHNRLMLDSSISPSVCIFKTFGIARRKPPASVTVISDIVNHLI